MIRVTVRYYQSLRDAAGAANEGVALDDDAKLGDLITRLASANELLARMRPSLLLAVNDEFAAPDTVLHEGDRVDIMPPASGG
jgi:molybdopterin converting factor small subunit